jgi:hypothetical protein
VRVNLRAAAALLLLVALAAFYVHAASEHARRVNVSRARADQSGYLWDAVGIYQMRHGSEDALIGERNRMPVYPWLLSWLYDPGYSPDQFFEVAKAWNIWLSLVLLAIVAAIATRYLPPLSTANLVLIAAFGYFVFKAGYAQVELLFYTIWFLMFLGCCHALASTAPSAVLASAAVGGALAAVAHLTKAAVLPFAVLAAGMLTARFLHAALVMRRATNAGRGSLWARALAPVLFAALFLGILSPYLANSKRVFGHYFYNVNSTFYVWYDDWPSASAGTYSHGDGVGWPKMPSRDIPSMRKYLREHTAGQIAVRIGDGLREMVTISYTRLWYFKPLALYLALAAAVALAMRREFAALVRARGALFIFLILYAGLYMLAVAFYKPISGTTQRMLLTHVLPLLFAILYFVSRPPFRDARWSIAGLNVSIAHVHLLVLATIAMDLIFTFWPRLMADFAGY